MDNPGLPHNIKDLACHPIRCFFSRIRRCRRYIFEEQTPSDNLKSTPDNFKVSSNIRCIRQLT